jgi:hypothetical protein
VSEPVDGAADELYGLPLEEFVPRRDALVRELRAAGQRDDAEMIKRMPKPSAPAWVVNRLARERPDELRELMETGEELRRVQEWLLRREADPADLRAAVEAERAAVGRLVHAGAELLIEAGRPARGDILERVGETLHAATADPALRAEVERGRVVRDQAAVGLGAATGPSYAPAGATRRSTRRREPADPRPEPQAEAPAPPRRRARAAKPKESAESSSKVAAERRKAAAAAREALRAAEAEAKAAERMRTTADRAVDRASRALTHAEESYERAQAQLREAREELAAAEAAASAAREAAEAAEADVAERRRGLPDEDPA